MQSSLNERGSTAQNGTSRIGATGVLYGENNWSRGSAIESDILCRPRRADVIMRKSGLNDCLSALPRV